MYTAVALDGPAGAGKSSIAKRAAKALDFIYVDTGALYRTIGYAATLDGIEPVDSPEVDALLAKTKVDLTFNDKGEQIVLLNGEDVSGFIRTPEASMTASKISAIPKVRAFLLDLQRNMAKTHNVIMDGRDIGTIILPDADLKVFLTASAEARARRRYAELTEKGIKTSVEELIAQQNERDARDSGRDVAPLTPAEDAVFLDNSQISLAETIDEVIRLATEKQLTAK